VEGAGVKRNVETTRDKLSNTLGDVCVFFEVDCFNAMFLGEREALWNGINPNYA
jgi:hypothetical protein